MLDLALPLIALLFADGFRRRGSASNAPVPNVHPQPTVAPAPAPQPRPQPAPGPRPQSAPAPRPPAAAPPAHVATHAPAPNVPPPAWPAAVPSDLPPFPGPGWMPHPSPGRVASRASALLSQLWARGEGTHVIEQTAGDWVAYQAKYMGSKKGVVAFVPRTTVAPLPTSAPVPRPPVVPAAPAPARPRPPAPAPTPALPPDIITVSNPAEPDFQTNRSTLSVGSKGADVVYLQKKLGVTAKGGGYTGYFGTVTESAVKAFQAAHGLPDDGVVGPSTWAALEAA